jgi:hypothetical protein
MLDLHRCPPRLRTALHGATGILLFITFPWICSAQAIDLTGTWVLNVARSSWGDTTQPMNVVIWIEHREPVLRYHGSVTYEDEFTREFDFQGRIDGKPYPVERSCGPGAMTLRRMDARTLFSSFKTTDGTCEESVTTRISADRKSMTREISYVTPSGRNRWTEVYDARTVGSGRGRGLSGVPRTNK